MLSKFGNSKSKIILVLLLILPFNLFFFPIRHNRLAALSGTDFPTIDVWFAYPPERVYSLLPSLGEQGRQMYALTELTLDVAYPVLYNTLMYLLLSLLLPLAIKANSPLQKLRRLPFGTFVCDILENCGIAVLLMAYPQQLTALAWATSFFSSLKWVLGLSGLAIIFLTAILAAVRGLRLKGTHRSTL